MIRNGLRNTAALAALLAVFAAPVPAHADGPTPQQRTEFNKLVQQRNKLSLQLERLDRQAAEAIQAGREPVVLHAEQVSTQDQLDLVELRLAIVATRYGLVVPPVRSAADGGDNSPEARIDQVFERGRRRALADLRKRAEAFLAAVDFSAFLDG